MSYINRSTCTCNEYPKDINYFKEEWFCHELCIPTDKPDIETISDVFISPRVISTKLIDTDEGLSNEGQLLTGKKLVVELCIDQNITYVADEPTQSVFSMNYKIFKSMFIVLPQKIHGKSICDLEKSSRLTVTPFLEHTYTRELNGQKFNTCMLLLLDVQFC